MFTWGKLSGPAFTSSLDAIYTEVVQWRRNSFTIPFGKAGKDFVRELSRLYSAFGSASALESVALKVALALPILLLQKPSRASKTKHHITHLERRLRWWLKGDLDELVREGRAIQQRLPKNGSNKVNLNLARSFSNLMFMGKCKAALDLLWRRGHSPSRRSCQPKRPTFTYRQRITDWQAPCRPTGIYLVYNSRWVTGPPPRDI